MDGLDSTSVKAELTKWREKYVDVATVLDEFVTLRGRTVLLRDEVRDYSFILDYSSVSRTDSLTYNFFPLVQQLAPREAVRELLATNLHDNLSRPSC